MRALLFLALLPLILSLSQASAATWTGIWETRWRDGGALLELHEDAAGHITGDYPLYGGKIDGAAKENTLKGRWIEGPRNGGFVFVMAGDGKSFMGRFDTGEWWTGERTERKSDAVQIDQTGVRQTFRTFVFASNLAKAGLIESVGAAAAVLDFGERAASLAPGQKLNEARALFELVDLTTFQLWSIPGKRASGESFALTLKQDGTGAELPLKFRHAEDGKWWLVMPPAQDLALYRKTLLLRFNGRLPPPDAFLSQRNARDAITKFLASFVDWDHGGEGRAVETLDTSELAPATQGYEGSLAAQYLKLTLDRISQITPQEIPNDPTSRQPFIHFVHPSGKIVIAPMGEGDKEVWKFTAETVRSARALFAAIEDMPIAAEGLPPSPPSGFFALRNSIRNHAPVLLRPVGTLELWQIAAAIVAIFLCLAAAAGVTESAVRLLRWDIGGVRLSAERRMVWPLRLLFAGLLFNLIVPVLGWPEEVRRVTAPAIALVVAVCGVWAAWHLISALSHNILKRFERTSAAMDEILLSLGLTALRLALVIAAILYVADAFSLPYGGLLAGLGIGGLAVAFASKETLANVFGAAILVADRPFRKGDWIETADVEGVVEDVGIRSTRVRTVQDTVVVIPNGKLADGTIANFGFRRRRLVETTLFVPYGKAARQIEHFVGELRLEVKKTTGGDGQVFVEALGQDAITVQISAYVSASTVETELEAKQKLMLAILAVADRYGISLGTSIQDYNVPHAPFHPVPAETPQGNLQRPKRRR